MHISTISSPPRKCQRGFSCHPKLRISFHKDVLESWRVEMFFARIFREEKKFKDKNLISHSGSECVVRVTECAFLCSGVSEEK